MTFIKFLYEEMDLYLTDDVSTGIGTLKIISMVEGVRMAVTSLHGTPVYLFTQSLTRALPHTYGCIQTCAWVYGLIIVPVQLKKEA